MPEPQRRFLLLRHGQTAWNAELRAQGHADISLDDTGVAQARAVAPHLAGYRPTRLWSSDLARAVETAECIAAATDLPIEKTDAFREYSIGVRTGLTLAEFAEQFPDEYAAWQSGARAAVEGAETDEDVLARFQPALRACLDAIGPGECGLIVSHGAALKLNVLAFLGLEDAIDEFAGLGNCHWVELEESSSAFSGGRTRWRLRGYNLCAPEEALAEEHDAG